MPRAVGEGTLAQERAETARMARRAYSEGGRRRPPYPRSYVIALLNSVPKHGLLIRIGERYAQIGIGNSFAETVEGNALSYKTAYIIT